MGAWFADTIDLEWTEITRPTWLRRCRFDQPARLAGLNTSHSMSFEGSAFAADLALNGAKLGGQLDLTGAQVSGKLDMTSADIGVRLLMRSVSQQHCSEFNDVVLNGAKVGGHVVLIGAKVAGTLDMDSACIGQSLLMSSLLVRRAEFNEVILNGAKIGGQVSLVGARVAGNLYAATADIGQSLFMRSDRSMSEHRAEFNGVFLSGAKVGGQVDLAGAKVAGKLDMGSADIGQSLFMRSDLTMSEHRAEFNDVILIGAKVGGQVDLTCTKVAGTLNMTSSDIAQSLYMASHMNVSEHRAEFKDVILIGAKVGGQVSLVGAKVDGKLYMDSADISRSLLMASDRTKSEHRAEFNDVVLNGAKVGGQVALIGAKVDGTLEMDSAEIGENLLMGSDGEKSEHRAEFNEIALRGAKVSGTASFTGANVTGTLNMESAQFGGNVFMRSDRSMSEHRAEFNEVFLSGAKVGGQVSLVGAKVAGKLDMNSADVSQGLLMRSDRRDSEHRAEFNEIVLNGAKVGGHVDLIGARVAGKLNMDSADIGQSLLMASDRTNSEHRAEFNEIVLNGAKVGGQVALVGAKVAGKLNMHSADIGQSLLMRGERRTAAEFDGGANLTYMKIGSTLDLRGAILSDLDLTRTVIGAELMLALDSQSPQWKKGGRLVLRNASVDAIHDTAAKGVWPPDLDLDGLTYRRFGGGVGAEADVARRGSGWFMDWLAKDEPFTPQPYHQCASVLREMGQPEMANDVLYEGRERERHELWAPWPGERGRGPRARIGRSLRWLKTMLLGRHPFPWHEEIRRSFRWLGLSLLAFVVGYGYGTRLFWRPLICAVLIAAIGVRVTYADAAVFGQYSFWWRTFFSLDMLLAIVELSREHTLVQAGLDGFAYGWFVIQNLLGWVLALFLIAGLTGLTK